MIDIVLLDNEALNDSEEYSFGFREMKRRLSAVRRWYTISTSTALSIENIVTSSDAEKLLVILDPALIISDNLLAELDIVDSLIPEKISCVVPGDPRTLVAGLAIDYATRPGFDRFVTRLVDRPRWGIFDDREPWVYLVERSALLALSNNIQDLSWSKVPALLASCTAVAQHAFVHSYADYYLNNRAEMLRLLPSDTFRLLDVGGGEGNFAATFMAARGGQATLLEANSCSAEKARVRGLDVLVGDFQSVEVEELYDCVSLLDVLEHLVDPLQALVKAHQIIKPGGTLLLSVPNAGCWAVVSDLIEGRFDYQPVGILCNTHLRFFTRHSLEILLLDAGFHVERWEAVGAAVPELFVEYVSKAMPSWISPDLESLSADSFHILARRS